MEPIKRKKCPECRQLFVPDARNKDRQQYCSKPACRKASKAASQKKWLGKPENQDYFKGSTNVERVKRWREQNPGYWRTPDADGNALQDRLTPQPAEIVDDNGRFAQDALQDSINAQNAVLIGLIAHITGGALQDDIEKSLHCLRQLGQDILNGSNPNKGGNHDRQIPDSAATRPKGAKELRMD
jgi:hypothetical protein